MTAVVTYYNDQLLWKKEQSFVSSGLSAFPHTYYIVPGETEIRGASAALSVKKFHVIYLSQASVNEKNIHPSFY